MITTVRLIVLFILLSLGAEAQIIRANAFYRPTAVAAAAFLLDDYPNAAAAYSLRKLKSSYSGSAIRIRRDSTGNAETDIGFTANGDLDTTAIKNHCRNNSCMVTTWYNQGDSTAIDFSQGTAANQPIIVSAGVIERRLGEPSIRIVNTGTTGTSDFMTAVSSTVKFNYLHKAGQAAVFVICQAGINADPNLQMIILDNTNTATASRGYMLQYNDVSPINNRLVSAVYRGVSGNATSSQAPDNYLPADTMHLITNLLNNSTATAADRNILYRNGANESKLNILTNTASTADASFNMRLGRSANATSLGFNGYVSEIILYPTDQSSNRTGIETNINNYYGIYTPRWDGTKDGLLDSFPNAAAAYSVRNLKKSYTGPLIRVRRADNTEEDIYGDINGNLDTAGIKAFAGSGDAFITTWYNQGDSTAVNFTQTTAASQPRIMTSGLIERRAGEPTIRFDRSGTVDWMSVASSTVKFNYLHQAGQAAVFAVWQAGVNNTNPNANYHLISNNTGTTPGYTAQYDDRTGVGNNLISNFVSRATSGLVSNCAPNNYFAADTLALLTNLLNNSTAIAADRNILYYDGGNEQKLNTLTNTAATGNAGNNMFIGRASNSTTSTLDGFISELIFYPTDQSSNRTGIETNINNYYGLW